MKSTLALLLFCFAACQGFLFSGTSPPCVDASISEIASLIPKIPDIFGGVKALTVLPNVVSTVRTVADCLLSPNLKQELTTFLNSKISFVYALIGPVVKTATSVTSLLTFNQPCTLAKIQKQS